MEVYPGLRVIVVPYDAGHRGLRMGAGPEYLLDNGLRRVLRKGGRELNLTVIRPEKDPPAEIATAFELDGLVSEAVSTALAAGELPLVLSGNCNTSVGTIAGAGGEGLGVVWFDGHADFSTPETTKSGFSDNMGLSIAVGHCWKAMAEDVPGFSPVAEENVVLAGVRDIEPAERDRLDASDVAVIDADHTEKDGLRVLTSALDKLKSRVGRVYVHLDLDVLDPGQVGRANQYAPDGGFDTETLGTAIGMVHERFAVAACGIASFDPAFDTGGRVLDAALAGARALTSRL